MKKYYSSLALSFLLAATARAQTVSPVPAPTIITTAPYTISAAGYYQLGANLSYAGTGATNEAIITINANNVTLDLAGHYLSGPVGSTTTTLDGVYAYEKANLTIQNGTIAHCYQGICLDGNNSATSHNDTHVICNILASGCTFSGITLNGAIGVAISNNRFLNIGGTTVGTFPGSAAAVYMPEGSGMTVTNNVITNVTGANTASGSAYGMVGSVNFVATGNTIGNIVAGSSGTPQSYGINGASFAIGNTVNTAAYGLAGCSKYKDNLTLNCTTSFAGGTAVGTND